nr:uncharacterized protein LOC117866470 [Setaria viridis]
MGNRIKIGSAQRSAFSNFQKNFESDAVLLDGGSLTFRTIWSDAYLCAQSRGAEDDLEWDEVPTTPVGTQHMHKSSEKKNREGFTIYRHVSIHAVQCRTTGGSNWRRSGETEALA